MDRTIPTLYCSPPHKKACNNVTQLPPVIVKLTDGNSNFKNISIAQRKRLQEDIFRAAGEPRDSTVLMGGDLAIYAFDEG